MIEHVIGLADLFKPYKNYELKFISFRE